MRRLVTPQRERRTGIMSMLSSCAFGEFIGKLDQAYRYDDQVIRYLTVKLENTQLHLTTSAASRDSG
ncbi:MAG: hypothetical protein R3C61_11775 [Bacteroidia bacterium]